MQENSKTEETSRRMAEHRNPVSLRHEPAPQLI